jgi:hypothetical protein
MYLPFYGINLESISCLPTSFFDFSRSFAGTYRGISFYFKKSVTSDNLVVSFHGARPARNNSPIIFRGYNWSFSNSDILCISDGLLSFHQGGFLSWYLDTRLHDFNDTYIHIINSFRFSREYKRVWFTGSSGGGFSALRMANLITADVLISNPQIYPEKFPFWSEFVKKLREAGDECLSWASLAPPPSSYMIIYQNILDSHHLYQHVIPFLKAFSTEYLARRGANCRIRRLGAKRALILFESDASSVACKHHSICFPGRLKHDEALSCYLDSESGSRHESLSVYMISDQIICSVFDPTLMLGGYEFCFYLMSGSDLIVSSGWSDDITVIFELVDPAAYVDLCVKLFVKQAGGNSICQRHLRVVHHFRANAVSLK